MSKKDNLESFIIQLASKLKYSPDSFISSLEVYLFGSGKDISLKDKAKAFMEIGKVVYWQSFFHLSASCWNHSLSYYLQENDRSGECECYFNLGFAYYNLHDYAKAIEYYERALKIAKDIQDLVTESRCWGNMGNVYHAMEDHNSAIEYYERALKIAKDIPDLVTDQSPWYRKIGDIYYNLHDYAKAIEYYERALKIAKDIADVSNECSCYSCLGLTYNAIGNYNKAIEYHEEALRIARDNVNRVEELRCYNNIGITYYNLHDYAKAIEYYERALKIAKDIADVSNECSCYINLGNAYDAIHDYNKAIEYHEEALRIARDNVNRVEELRCYNNIGVIYHRSLHDYNKAIEYHEEALRIAREISNLEGEAACYLNMGTSYGGLHDYAKAIEYYERALKIARDVASPVGEGLCYYSLGVLYFERQPELAYDNLKKLAALIESTASKLVEEEHKIAFLGKEVLSYQFLIELCVRLKKEEEAFEYVQRSKSRALLDLLAAVDITPRVPLTDQLSTLVEREKQYLAKLRQIQTQNRRDNRIALEPGETERLRKELDNIYNMLEKHDKQYVSLRRARPLSLDAIKDVLKKSGDNSILVEYYVTNEKVFIFIVTTQGLDVRGTELSRDKLSTFLSNYEKEVVQYTYRGDMGNTWLELTKHLIEPISDYLSKSGLIYFVPHDLLHYLPLHALQLYGKPIIKIHQIVYSASASLLQFYKTKGGCNDRCASFGVVLRKEEEIFGEEAKNIADILNGQYFPNATKETVLKNLTNNDILHFSCHGYFASNLTQELRDSFIQYNMRDVLFDKDPLSSGIVLQDGILTEKEIFDLRMNAELVTLSACETGMSDIRPGDELVGLTRSLQYAGAASIVVSLWSVATDSTMELMQEFYGHIKEGKDKATALQLAQIKIMEKYPHPYYWAPFILVGDWE